MTAKEIYAELRRIAPSVVFSASVEEDTDCKWDGDGHDPAEEGYKPYIVTVSAKAIVNGKMIEGESYLSGHYMKPGEAPDDMGGYLPQKLEEAARELRGMVVKRCVLGGRLDAVLAFLKREMRERYEAQMAGR